MAEDLQLAPWETDALPAAPWDAKPDEGGFLQSAGKTALDVAKQIPTGLVTGVESLASTPAVLARLAGQGLDYIGLGGDPEAAAEQKKIRELASEQRKGGIAQYLPEPETRVGRVARTVAEFAPAAITGTQASIPASIVRQAVIPGVASEAAGQVAEEIAPAAAPYVRAATAMATGMRGAPNTRAVPTVEHLEQAAVDAYRHPDVQALRVAPDAMKNLTNEIYSDLNKVTRERMAPTTYGLVEDLQKNLTPTATIADIDSVRKILNRQRVNFAPNAGEERLAANIAVKKIDDWLGNIAPPDVVAGNAQIASPILKEARANWAAARRAENVDNKIADAMLRAESTYSGGNIDNAVRQNLRRILESKNERQRLGWTEAELTRARQIVKGGQVTDFLREVGNRLSGNLGLYGTLGVAGLGAYAGHPEALYAAGLYPVGRGAKALANRYTANEARGLSEMLRSRSPEAQQWNRIQGPPVQQPDPRALQAAVYAQPALQQQGYARGGSLKQPKAAVNYGKGMPSAHCGICTYFHKNGVCDKVQGKVASDMWCRLYRARKKS